MKYQVLRLCLLLSFVATLPMLGATGCNPAQPEIKKDLSLEGEKPGLAPTAPPLPKPPGK